MNKPRLEKKEYKETNVNQYVWEPGNCTRYEIDVVIFENKIKIMWMNKHDGGRCMTASNDSVIHYSYMMEKMGINEPNAAAILALLKLENLISVILPKKYNNYGVYD